MHDEIETRLAAARTRLILDKPFLGALVLRLPLKPGDPKWCRTIATDARALYYNSGYVKTLSLDGLQFMLAHEALHCALSHFARRQHRVKHRWDVACDYAINPLLVDEGLKPPPGVLYFDEYRGLTAEEIYPLLRESDETTPDQHIYDEQQAGSLGAGGNNPTEGGKRQEFDEKERGGPGRSGAGADGSDAGGAPQPQPLSAQERDTLKIQWQQRLASAAQQAMQAGKLGGAMARLVDHLLQPQLPWRMLLARYLTALARDDYSYLRPSRREGSAIFPSLRSTGLNLAVAIDTSGSLHEHEIAEFVAEVNAIKGQIRARVNLLPCDAELAKDAPWVYEAWEEFVLPAQVPGGGGTSFCPPFAWAEQQDRAPDLLLYFTDADGEFPQAEPPFPVIWLVKGRGAVPWGQRIQLN